MDFDPKVDYYKRLWLDENATDEEIKKAFKKLAVKYHPDKKWWNKEKFQEINEAFQLLSNKQKRQQYDSIRKWWFDPSGFWWFGWGQWWWVQFDFGWWWVDLWDIMGDLFGGGHSRWRSRQTQWEDIQVGLVISFEDAFLGVTKTIQYTKDVIPEWVKAETCPQCNGQWAVIQQVRTPFGVMQSQQPCPHCNWTGKIYKKDWQVVSGLTSAKETLEVKIPAGIKDWVFIKFAWKWDESFGGATWDLYIKIQIKKSDKFERKDNNLYVNVDVSVFDLVLGWEIVVPHPEWEIKVKIPKWTQTQNKIKVSWKWYWEKWIFSHKWDMYLIPNLHIPKKLSKKQKKLYQKLQKEG